MMQVKNIIEKRFIMNKPTCSLCQNELMMKKNVTIQSGGTNVLNYSLAWVCNHCSAAFPIASTGSLFKSNKPLYDNGKKTS